MTITHQLPEAVFAALAEGAGDLDSIQHLRQVQQDKHLMLLADLKKAATADEPGATALRAGYDLLAALRAAGTEADTWLLGLPHMGAWTHRCQLSLVQDDAPDFGYFACLAAAAAVRIGFRFELTVPVRAGRILLPGLGFLRVTEQADWVTMRCDGDHVTVGDWFQASWRDLVPDGGCGKPVPHWSGTPLLRATAGQLSWHVLMETEDRSLDLYARPMYTGLQARELRPWRHRIQLAWEILVRHHRWAAEPMTAGISVIVPLQHNSGTDLVSATAPAVFGAIATSWPPDPVTMAETLVHEFQHVKLGGLMDMVRLVESGKGLVYAPWRSDPRPADALLQGTYAHLGIIRFWQSQRDAEIDPDSILRAQVQFMRWRPAIERAVRTMFSTHCLTPDGLRFVRQLHAWEKDLTCAPIPRDAQDMAAEASLDHWLTWQIQNVAVDAAAVADLAAAYRRGELFSAQHPPMTSIERDTRRLNVTATNRSRLLTTRYLAPARYRTLLADKGVLPEEADILLIAGKTEAAIQAYRDRITGSAEAHPDAWIGLALALHHLPSSPFAHTFGTRLALLFELHRHMSDHGYRRDPLELARWLG